MIIVDRIEESIAVTYDGSEKIEIPLAELPAGVHEGSVLRRTGSGWETDPEAEEQRRAQIAAKMRRIFK